MIGHAQAGALAQLQQQAGIEAHGSVVTLDDDAPVIDQCGGFQAAFDPVEGRPETQRQVVIDPVAEGRLQGHHVDFAVVAEEAALEAFFVLGDHAVGHIEAQAEGPLLVQRIDVETHGHAGEGHHVAIIAAGQWLIGQWCAAGSVVNAGLGQDHRRAHAGLLALEQGHAGRVAIHRGGVVGRGGTTGKGRAHGADTLFVEGKTGSQQ